MTKMLMAPLYTLVKPNNYVVIAGEGKREKVVFGLTIPLSKKAANSYARKYHPKDSRVIMRKTAQRAGLI